MRICLDLNVYVAAEIALVKGRHDTTPLRLMEACRGGRFDLVVSRAILDLLTDVLRRPPLSLGPPLATERSDLIAEMAALSNLLVVGGGVVPLGNTEERGVLEAALAGRADHLATYNLEDFAPIAVPDPDTGHLRIRTLQILHPRTLADEIGLY